MCVSAFIVGAAAAAAAAATPVGMEARAVGVVVKGLRGLDLPDALSGVYCAVERLVVAAAAGIGYLGVRVVVCTCSLGGVGLDGGE